MNGLVIRKGKKKKVEIRKRYGRLMGHRKIMIFVLDEVITSVLRNEIRSKSKGDALWKVVPPFFTLLQISSLKRSEENLLMRGSGRRSSAAIF
jgi:hypothetical protein